MKDQIGIFRQEFPTKLLLEVAELEHNLDSYSCFKDSL